MSSYSTKYRKEHPESYKKQQEAKKIKYENDVNYREQQLNNKKNKYETDPEFRAKAIQRAKDRYHQIKQLKANESIVCN